MVAIGFFIEISPVFPANPNTMAGIAARMSTKEYLVNSRKIRANTYLLTINPD
jgi:hypothetical protein